MKAEESVRIATRFGSATDRGPHRAVNEDALLAASPVFVVADGMGGHEAGEVASSLAVDALLPLVGRPVATAAGVRQCLGQAQDRLREVATHDGRDAGTTVAGAFLAEQEGVPYWLVVNLGDSRTYRLSHGRLEQISVDHSEVQELLDSGQITPAQARYYPRRHVVTRALGAGIELKLDSWLIPMRLRDRILVCSDGLTAEVADDVIMDILMQESEPQIAAERLVDAALAAGGRDNVSVVVVDALEVAGADYSNWDTTSDRPHDPWADQGDDDEDTLPRAPRAATGGNR